MLWVSALKKGKIKKHQYSLFTADATLQLTHVLTAMLSKYSELYSLQGEKNKRSKKMKDSFLGRKEGEFKIEGMVRSEKRIITVMKLYYY